MDGKWVTRPSGQTDGRTASLRLFLLVSGYRRIQIANARGESNRTLKLNAPEHPRPPLQGPGLDCVGLNSMQMNNDCDYMQETKLHLKNLKTESEA